MPIIDPNENDVLCGRGKCFNHHAGNMQFRNMIHSKKKEYLASSTQNYTKAHIATGIVHEIRMIWCRNDELSSIQVWYGMIGLHKNYKST